MADKTSSRKRRALGAELVDLTEPEIIDLAEEAPSARRIKYEPEREVVKYEPKEELAPWWCANPLLRVCTQNSKHKLPSARPYESADTCTKTCDVPPPLRRMIAEYAADPLGDWGTYAPALAARLRLEPLVPRRYAPEEDLRGYLEEIHSDYELARLLMARVVGPFQMNAIDISPTERRLLEEEPFASVRPLQAAVELSRVIMSGRGYLAAENLLRLYLLSDDPLLAHSVVLVVNSRNERIRALAHEAAETKNKVLAAVATAALDGGMSLEDFAALAAAQEGPLGALASNIFVQNFAWNAWLQQDVLPTRHFRDLIVSEIRREMRPSTSRWRSVGDPFWRIVAKGLGPIDALNYDTLVEIFGHDLEWPVPMTALRALNSVFGCRALLPTLASLPRLSANLLRQTPQLQDDGHMTFSPANVGRIFAEAEATACDVLSMCAASAAASTASAAAAARMIGELKNNKNSYVDATLILPDQPQPQVQGEPLAAELYARIRALVLRPPLDARDCAARLASLPPVADLIQTLPPRDDVEGDDEI